MHHLQLKPLAEQTLVITGASSGIGLVTARCAAAAGARVVLAARNEADLQTAVAQIRAAGGRAVHCVADVADPEQVAAIGEAAVRAFGGLDTWVNNAAVGLYGLAVETPLDELRRQFDVNYWGQVHGSRVAVAHLRERGGALINVASVLADRAIPLQANYCASKHAVKAFTDALRMELAKEGVPIAVSLIKPASIDTPLFDKARTHLGVRPRPVGPAYPPEEVARAILACAERPQRDLVVGGLGRLLGLAAQAPRLADRYLERTAFEGQQTAVPVDEGRPDNLFSPLASDGGERGHGWSGRRLRRSLYTRAALHPRAVATAASGFGLGLLLVAGARALRARDGEAHAARARTGEAGALRALE